MENTSRFGVLVAVGIEEVVSLIGVDADMVPQAVANRDNIRHSLISAIMAVLLV